MDGPARTALIKPLVFGGIDGLTTTLSLVWGSMAAGERLVSSNAVLVLGVANLMATATSMGIGDYVGTLAQYESEAASRRRQQPAQPAPIFDDTPLSGTTHARGASRPEAPSRRMVIDTGTDDDEPRSASSHGPLVVPVGPHAHRPVPQAHTHSREDAEELAVVRRQALHSGITMFVSFVLFGGMPLLPYLPMGASALTRRLASTLLCVASFFALGVARAVLEHSPSGAEDMPTVGVLRRPRLVLILDGLCGWCIGPLFGGRSRGAIVLAGVIRTSVRMMLMGVAAALVSFLSSKLIYVIVGAPEE